MKRRRKKRDATGGDGRKPENYKPSIASVHRRSEEFRVVEGLNME
jgi:hypothetical protein